jgi:hypothetical protein
MTVQPESAAVREDVRRKVVRHPASLLALLVATAFVLHDLAHEAHAATLADDTAAGAGGEDAAPPDSGRQHHHHYAADHAGARPALEATAGEDEGRIHRQLRDTAEIGAMAASVAVALLPLFDPALPAVGDDAFKAALDHIRAAHHGSQAPAVQAESSSVAALVDMAPDDGAGSVHPRVIYSSAPLSSFGTAADAAGHHAGPPPAAPEVAALGSAAPTLALSAPPGESVPVLSIPADFHHAGRPDGVALLISAVLGSAAAQENVVLTNNPLPKIVLAHESPHDGTPAFASGVLDIGLGPAAGNATPGPSSADPGGDAGTAPVTPGSDGAATPVAQHDGSAVPSSSGGDAAPPAGDAAAHGRAEQPASTEPSPTAEPVRAAKDAGEVHDGAPASPVLPETISTQTALALIDAYAAHPGGRSAKIDLNTVGQDLYVYSSALTHVAIDDPRVTVDIFHLHNGGELHLVGLEHVLQHVVDAVL